MLPFMNIRLLLTLGLALLLSGCAQQLTAPKTPLPTYTWSQRLAVLSKIHSWNLKGAISIRDSKGANMGSFTWRQKNAAYHISISGPLGIGGIKITGGPGKVTLRKSAKEVYTASNPEQLMQQRLGWQFPLRNLTYWVRGIPAPGIPAQKKMGANMQLVALKQQGWQINFSRYQRIGNITLPSKLDLFNARLQVRIIIKNWTL